MLCCECTKGVQRRSRDPSHGRPKRVTRHTHPIRRRDRHTLRDSQPARLVDRRTPAVLRCVGALDGVAGRGIFDRLLSPWPRRRSSRFAGLKVRFVGTLRSAASCHDNVQNGVTVRKRWTWLPYWTVAPAPFPMSSVLREGGLIPCCSRGNYTFVWRPRSRRGWSRSRERTRSPSCER